MKWKNGDAVIISGKYSFKPGVSGTVVEVNNDRHEVMIEFTDGARNWFVPDWLEAAAPKAQGGGQKHG